MVARFRCESILHSPVDFSFSCAFAQITAYQHDFWQFTHLLYGLHKRLSVLLRQFSQIPTMKVRQAFRLSLG